MHGSHDLASGCQGNLVGKASDTEVRDFDCAVWSNQQVSGFDVAMDQPCLVGSVKRSSRLSDNMQHLGGGKNFLPLEHNAQGLTRYEFHHEIGAAVFLAVVKDVRDALMIDQRSMPGFGAESLPKARVAHVLILQNFDGYGAPDDRIIGFPHFPHATDGDTGEQFIT